jgi:hypothetical protein
VDCTVSGYGLVAGSLSTMMFNRVPQSKFIYSLSNYQFSKEGPCTVKLALILCYASCVISGI